MKNPLNILLLFIAAIIVTILATLYFSGRDIPENNSNVEIKKELELYMDSVSILHEQLKSESDNLGKKVQKDTIIIIKRYNEKADSIVELGNNQSIELFTKYISEIDID